ncbi:MAG: hypothetical protein HZB86_04200 [Deltaproteobacteria bacterium]|nr:hypothetical protein [Deltaproteobacteria bacterium]
MRRHANVRSPRHPMAFLFLLVAAACLAGCAAGSGAGTAPPGMHGGPGATGKADLPKDIDVRLRLAAGDSWKSRYLSTSETRRTLVTADGKATVKSRSVGLELVAVQKVVSVEGTVARIEISESDARILQDGKFLTAPYKQFNPPNPVVFTLDTAAGKADFTAVRDAYGKWMAGLKEGPAGDIVGKTFRLAAYLAAIEEMYVKPFTRVAGRTVSKEETATGKDVVLPFLGHGAGAPPVPVEGSMRYTGFSAAGGLHLLAVEGKYEGRTTLSSREDLEVRLAEFGVKPTAEFSGSGEMNGRFRSSVDALSGREVSSSNRLTYTAEWAFGGSKLVEEVAGKSTLEKAE